MKDLLIALRRYKLKDPTDVKSACAAGPPYRPIVTPTNS